jgi:hypothetical protein
MFTDRIGAKTPPFQPIKHAREARSLILVKLKETDSRFGRSRASDGA